MNEENFMDTYCEKRDLIESTLERKKNNVNEVSDFTNKT